MKLNKKAEFDLQSFLVTFVLFIAIMVTLGLTSVNMGNNYQPITNRSIDSSFATTYDQLNTIDEKTQDIQSKVEDTTTGTSDSSSEFLGDALTSLKLIVPALSTSTSMINSMATTLGVPDILVSALGLIMIIMLITVILFMIFRYR